MFKERAEALMAAFASSPTPRYLVADAKLYTEDTAATLAKLGFITRIPGTLKLVSQVITQALQCDRWDRLDETTRYDAVELCHYGMAQRWLVVSSQAAMERAEVSITKAQQRAWDAIEKQRLHLHAKRFETPEAAQAALTALSKAWRSHQRDTSRVIDHKRYAGKGRPTPTSPLKAIEWQMHAQVRPAQEVIAAYKQQSACFVIGTNNERPRSKLRGIKTLKTQNLRAIPSEASCGESDPQRLKPATRAMRRCSEPRKPNPGSRAGSDFSKTHCSLCRRCL